MDEATEAPTAGQPQAQQQQPGSINVEMPQDLLLVASQALQRPPELVLQVLGGVIAQMVIRGLGVKVGPPPRQDGILVARGMPPAPPVGPRVVRP